MPHCFDIAVVLDLVGSQKRVPLNMPLFLQLWVQHAEPLVTLRLCCLIGLA